MEEGREERERAGKGRSSGLVFLVLCFVSASWGVLLAEGGW